MGALFANIYGEITTNEEIAIYAEEFVFTNFIFNNFVIVIMVFVLLLAVTLYAKKGPNQK